MSKQLLSIEAVNDLIALSRIHQIESFVIERDDAGDYKVEYTIGERKLNPFVLHLLETLALGMKQGKEYEMTFRVEADTPYIRLVELSKGKVAGL